MRRDGLYQKERFCCESESRPLQFRALCWRSCSCRGNRAKAVSSVKEDSGFIVVVVEFAGVWLPCSSLFLAVDDGCIAVACNEFTRDVRCTTFCCSDCTVEDNFDSRSISTLWSPLLFWCRASRDCLSFESPLMFWCEGSWERALSFEVLFIELSVHTN